MKSEITYGNVPAKYIKTKEYTYIHVFTDNKDVNFKYGEVEPCFSDSLKKAYDLAAEWILNGEKNIRIYIVHEFEDYRDGQIDQLTEKCILSIGNYPY